MPCGITPQMLFHELPLFIVVVVLVFYLIRLFYYDGIHKSMRAQSRCWKEKNMGSATGQYQVVAHSMTNEPLYSVAYDLAQKKSEIKCACKSGDVVQKFTDVYYYDMSNTMNPIQKAQKMCQCKGGIYDAKNKDQIYFTGHPALVRFMNTAGNKNMHTRDTSFFDAAFNRPKTL